MDKEQNNIEDLITEGFWDSIINKAKRMGLAAGSALGSNQTRGKLDLNTFATSLYDQYKYWLGTTNHPATLETIALYLVNQVNMPANFVQQVTGVTFDQMQGQDQGQQQPQQNNQSDNAGDFEDPIGHIQGSNGGSQSQAGSNDAEEEQSDYEPGEGDFHPVKKALKDFMRYAVYGAFKRTIAARGFDKNAPLGTKFSPDFDGSFIFSHEKGPDPKLADLIKASKTGDIQDVADKLRQGQYFGTWDDFKKLVPGGERLKAGSPDEADLFRQALKQSELDYNLNFPKNLRRFVLAVPPAEPDPRAATNLQVADGNPSAKYAATSESEEFDLDILTEAGEKQISDSQLRKAFTTIAQRAMQDGVFKAAAQNTLQNLRGDAKGGMVPNHNGGGTHYTIGQNGNQGGNQGGGQANNQGGQNNQQQQQQQQGNDMLVRAAKLGDKLGIRLDKFALTDFKKKDEKAYREFMGWLKQENPDNFDPGFLDHAKETLSKHLDYEKLEDRYSRNGNTMPKTEEPQGDAAQGGDQKQDGEQANTAGDQGDEQNSELKYYDIDRRKIAWDAKNEMLHIQNNNAGGKAREKSYKRTEDGWLTDSNLIANKAVTNQLDTWYDQVMQMSGGEEAKDQEPDTSDPNVIPSGAKVQPVKDGQKMGVYTFDGKSWRNENGTAVPEENKASIEMLNKLYREKRGVKEPEQQANNQQADNGNNAEKQNDQEAQPASNDQEQKQPEQQPQADQAKAGGGMLNHPDEFKDKQVPKGAQVNTGKTSFTFNGDAWQNDNDSSVVIKRNTNAGASLDKDYFEKPAEQPQQQAQQGDEAKGQEQQAQQPKQNAPKQEVPVGARLKLKNGFVRKMQNKNWWDETNKKYMDPSMTSTLNANYNRALAANNQNAVPPAPETQGNGPPQAKDGTSFTMPSGKKYTKNGHFWVDDQGNHADNTTTHYLDRESGKQQGKADQKQRMADANQKQQALNNANDTREVPMNATFQPANTKRVLQRKKDGWVENGKLIDNPSQVEIFDRGWRNANRKKSA